MFLNSLLSGLWGLMCLMLTLIYLKLQGLSWLYFRRLHYIISASFCLGKCSTPRLIVVCKLVGLLALCPGFYVGFLLFVFVCEKQGMSSCFIAVLLWALAESSCDAKNE